MVFQTGIRMKLYWINFLLDSFWWRGLRGVGQDEVDEHGGEGEDGAHHGEGEREATDLVQGAANHRAHDLAWIGLDVNCFEEAILHFVSSSSLQPF